MKIRPEKIHPQTEDAVLFGEGQYVYCLSHLAAHLTGWCTVGIDHKVGLGIPKAEDPKQFHDSLESARAKCRTIGLKLYSDILQ